MMFIYLIRFTKNPLPEYESWNEVIGKYAKLRSTEKEWNKRIAGSYELWFRITVPTGKRWDMRSEKRIGETLLSDYLEYAMKRGFEITFLYPKLKQEVPT